MTRQDNTNNKSVNKWFLGIATVVFGGLVLYFTQYLWASARQAENNTARLCIVEKTTEENKQELKENTKEDRKLNDKVIEMGGDIKRILALLREMRRTDR